MLLLFVACGLCQCIASSQFHIIIKAQLKLGKCVISKFFRFQLNKTNCVDKNMFFNF